MGEESRNKYQGLQAESGTKSFQNTYLVKMLGSEKAAQLQKKYILDINKKLDKLKIYLKEKDLIEIREIAHKLKGSGEAYGFKEITETGTKLSEYAKRDDYPGLSKLVQNLETWLVSIKDG